MAAVHQPLWAEGCNDLKKFEPYCNTHTGRLFSPTLAEKEQSTKSALSVQTMRTYALRPRGIAVNTTILILIAFMGGAGIAALIVFLLTARQRHTLYERAIRAETTLEAERAGHAATTTALQNAEHHLRESFAQLSNDALKTSTEQFLTLAHERLERQHQAARSDLTTLLDPLRTTLDQQRDHIATLEQRRERAYGSMDTAIADLKEGQRQLTHETNNLVKALSKPQVRGRWGEIQLRRVIEMAGMLEHCDFDTQVSTTTADATTRPDMIVRLPNDRQIIIDSKVPLTAFLEALDASDEQRADHFRRHARQVRQHIETMSKRNYPASFPEAYDFTVIFIPGETLYQTALEYDADLLDDAFNKSIILASPNTLIALLKAAAFGWRETRLAAETQTIRAEGEKIYRALSTIAEHLSKLGASLGKATNAYNSLIGSVETRLLPPARKMNELGIQETKSIPELTSIEISARPIVRAELCETDPPESEIPVALT